MLRFVSRRSRWGLGLLAIGAFVLWAPTTAHAQVSCAGVPAFASCTVYASGASVVFNNTKYTSIAPVPATRDCPPSSPYDPATDNWWVNNGACGVSSTPTSTATATGTATATATTVRATATATTVRATATATAVRATATATAVRATATATATRTNTATSTATATATTGTGTGNCAGVPAFATCTAYASGAKAVFNNTLYHTVSAVPSTRDCPPSSPFDPSSDNWWVSEGACTTGPTPTRTPTATATGSTPSPTATPTGPTPTPDGCNTATPTPVPPWTIGTAYKVGDLVSYAGKTYVCVIAHTAIAGWEPNGGGSTLWAVSTAGGTPPPPPPPVAAGHKYRVGYFVQWGIYGRQYFVKNLDTTGAASKLTHVLYAFSNIDGTNGTCLNGVVQGVGGDPEGVDQGTGAGDASADYGRPAAASESVDGVADVAGAPLMGNFNQLRKLKTKYPNLHVLMSIGGWTYSKFFSKVASTAAARQKFVSSCVDMYLKGNLPVYNGAGGTGSAAWIFDGIDIDWEYPGSVNGHPGNIVNCVQPAAGATDPFAGSCNDKANFVALMAEFRSQMDAYGNGLCPKRHYDLTAFGTGDGDSKLGLGWDVPNLMKSFDFVNVQGYDFHGVGSDNTWEPNQTGHQANLNVDTTPPADPYPFHFSGDKAITAWINAGASASQLTLGIPFYARIWKGVTDGGVHGEWQPAQGAACGQFGCDNVNSGTRNTNNLSAISCSGANIFHDMQAVATFCYNGNEWATYDDASTIAPKMTYIKNKGLLGAMIWEMSGDSGELMSAIHSNLP
jgi:chitinase